MLICNFYNYCNRHLCAFVGGIKNKKATLRVYDVMILRNCDFTVSIYDYNI